MTPAEKKARRYDALEIGGVLRAGIASKTLMSRRFAQRIVAVGKQQRRTVEAR